MATVTPPGGVAPILSLPPLQSGRYYFAPNNTAIGTSSGLGVGTLRLAAWYLPNAVTLSRIGAEVTSAGDAGSKVRLGIYADDGTGRPGSLAIDAGTIAGDSAAVQEITISQLLAGGLYWIGGAVQVVAVTQPTVRTISAGPITVADAGTSAPPAGSLPVGLLYSAVTGALPALLGSPGVSGSGPRVFVKVQ